jgi:hypothetical protein
LAPYVVSNGHAGSGCRVVLSYHNGTACADLPLPQRWSVRPDDALLAQLRTQTTVKQAGFLYG